MNSAPNTVKFSKGQERWRQKYGPWAVVTGSSDGIGKDLAKQLAEAGLNVVLVGRQSELLQALQHELTGRFGVEAVAVNADLSRPDGVQSVISAVRDKDVGLFAAVAGFGTSGSFLDISVGRELDMIDVNCRSVVELTHVFAADFASKRRGGLILMSSLLAFQGVPRASTYAATKAFIQTFAEGLRLEMRQYGVDVVASAPGPVNTGFNARAGIRSNMSVTSAAVAALTIVSLGQRGTVRPGFLSKFLEISLMPLPRRGRSRMMGWVMSGMTRHQNKHAGLGQTSEVG